MLSPTAWTEASHILQATGHGTRIKRKPSHNAIDTGTLISSLLYRVYKWKVTKVFFVTLLTNIPHTESKVIFFLLAHLLGSKVLSRL